MESVMSNQHILQQMIDSIESFETQDSDLAKLISRLETLLESLDHVPDDWSTAFLSKWGVLEEVYAYALDEGMTQLEDEDTQLIVEAIDSIKALIRSFTEKSSPKA